MLQWEELRRQSLSVTPKELCKDHPDLLTRVEQEIKALEQFDCFVPRLNRELGSADEVRETGSLTTQSQLRIEQMHARGGIGVVYRAHDLQLGRGVAVKFMQPSGESSPDRRNRFLREARIAARLEHPGSVPVYGVGEDSAGRPCYTMRFIDGETMQSAIDRLHASDISSARFRSVAFRQLLSRLITVGNTIAYAHSRAILHRDLKPANIMLGRYGETLIVDWGLAKELNTSSDEATSDIINAPESSDEARTLTRTGATFGTPAFMSPEQARGEWSTLGPDSDIYSLGATLFVLLTGTSPYQGKSPGEIALRTRRGSAPAPRDVHPSVPRALDAICRRAMQALPDRRYASALDLVADLENWLADATVSVYRETVWERLIRWVRRYRQAAALGSIFLLLSIVGLVWGLVRISAEERKTESAYRKATANLNTARDAVDQLYTKISENRLLHEPGAEALRKDMLQAARDYYQRLQAANQESWQLELDAARAAVRVADITSEIESPTKAIRLFQDAVNRLEELSQNPAAQSATRVELVRGYAGLGNALITNGRQEDAERYLHKALEHQRALLAERPESSEYLLGLGELLSNHAATQIGQGKSADALASLDNAAVVYAKIYDKDATNSKALQGLCVVHSNRGAFLRLTERLDEVPTAYEQALQAARALVALESHNDSFRDSLAATCHNVASFKRQIGLLDESQKLQSEAVSIYRALSREYPRRISYRIHLAASLHNLGAEFWTANQAVEAEATYSEAIECYQAILKDQPSLDDVALELATAQQELGQVIAGETWDREPSRGLPYFEQSMDTAAAVLGRSTQLPRAQEIHDLSKSLRDKAVGLARPATQP